jgi:phenylacetate-CoA ligase
VAGVIRVLGEGKSRIMNLRKWLYFTLVGLRGQPLGAYYNRFLREAENGIPADTTRRLLVQLLTHCRQSVPYYAQLMRDVGNAFHEDPEEYLRRLPILTKDTIRSHFDELKSGDLARRKWYFNFSSGSTGEAIRLIQDWEYATRSGAATLLYSKLIGSEAGDCEVHLWGSVRDITEGTEGFRAKAINKLTRTIFLNTFRMTPTQMRDYIAIINAKRPKLIVAYVEPIYELARFSEREGLDVAPQAAIMTTAGTLYPSMRETIGRMFQCKVFNRYGSREVGDVACERPGYEGLWVAPWCNYVEVVDSAGNRVPDGTAGEILVTSLSNYAMPLIRYRIGDRGVLAPLGNRNRPKYGQVLDSVVGRISDNLRNKNGDFVYGGYLIGLLYFRDWVLRCQIVQKSLSRIVYRIVKSEHDVKQAELDEIATNARRVMGDDCEVVFEFVDEISPFDSGKHRYIVSEV